MPLTRTARRRLLPILAGLLLASPAAVADGIAVIMARDAPALALDMSTLRGIYLKKFQMDDQGQAFIPVNLPPEHPLRSMLSALLFNRSAQALQDYWNQQYFHGIEPPYVLESEEAVVQFVATTPGAIGYVADCHLDPAIREVMLLPVPEAARTAYEALCGVPSAGEP